MKRRSIPNSIALQVLTEAGYRCAVPTCRGILAVDIHHLVEVSEDGSNELSNLLALCPTCHALFHRGEIQRDSIYAWKAMLVSLSHAFDTNTVDDLLFLSMPEATGLRISADGVLKFSRLIASGLTTAHLVIHNHNQSHYLCLYSVELTTRGQQLVDAWRSGDRTKVAAVFGNA